LKQKFVYLKLFYWESYYDRTPTPYVCLKEYTKEWAELFAVEAATLHTCIGDIVSDIQHVGSTAVPGLRAKPILDIAVAVPSSKVITKVAERLSKIDYIDRGDGVSQGGYLLVKESEPDIRTVHLHIVELTDIQWRNLFVFETCYAMIASFARNMLK